MKRDITRFLEHLKLNKGHSDNTTVAYKTDLNQFLEWFINNLNGHPASWSYLTGAVIAKYINFMKEKGYRTTTIARKTSVVRSLIFYLSKIREVPFSRTASLPSSVKVPKQKPRVLGDQEMERLCAVVETDQGRLSRRNRALFYLIYATGLNISEALNLNISDIDFDKAQITIGGKAGRVLQMDGLTEVSLFLYIEEERPTFLREEGCQALFLCHRSGKRLGRSYFWEALQNYARKAGLSGLVLNCHSLRGTFASRQLREGRDLKKLGEILGHKDLSATRRYRTFVT